MFGRCFCAVLIVSLAGAVASQAEGNEPTCACGYPRHRPTPCERCCRQPVCVQVPVAQPQVAAPQGAFAAPPRTGAVAGESQAPGMTGMAIHFPAFSLRLPTIQLPGFTRFRTDAQMYVDSAQAPYVEQFRREYTVDAGPQLAGVVERAPPAAQPQAAPPATAAPQQANQACEQNEVARLRRREYELEQRLRQLEQHLQRGVPPAGGGQRCEQNCPVGQPLPLPMPPPPVPSNVPQGPPPGARPEALPCPTPEQTSHMPAQVWENTEGAVQLSAPEPAYQADLAYAAVQQVRSPLNPPAEQVPLPLLSEQEPAKRPNAWQRMAGRLWGKKAGTVR